MENLGFLVIFFSASIYQNGKEPHKISLSEPTVLFMKFPTRVYTPVDLDEHIVEHKIINNFKPISFKMFCVLKRTVSLRWFF